MHHMVTINNLDEKIVDYFKFRNREFMEKTYSLIPNKTSKLSIEYATSLPGMFLNSYKTREGFSYDELFGIIDQGKMSYEDVAKQTIIGKDKTVFSGAFLKEMTELMNQEHISLNKDKLMSYAPCYSFISDYSEFENPFPELFNKVKEINITSNPNDEKDLKMYSLSNVRYAADASISNGFYSIRDKKIFLLEDTNKYLAKLAYHKSKKDSFIKDLISVFDSEKELTSYLKLSGLLHEIGEYGTARKQFFGDQIDNSFLEYTGDISPGHLEKIKSSEYSELIPSVLELKECDNHEKIRKSVLISFKITSNIDSYKLKNRKVYETWMEILKNKDNVYDHAKEMLKTINV